MEVVIDNATCPECQQDTDRLKRGVCGRCYQQHRRNGDYGPIGDNGPKSGPCDECRREVARIRVGLCDSCYQRARHRGMRARGEAPTCSVENCGGFVVARQMCNTHYLRFLKHGDVEQVRITREACAIETCDKPHFGLGYCSGHYGRLKKHGDVQADKPLKKFRGRGEGYINTKGYKVLADGRLEHRVVMGKTIGRPVRPDEQVHHKNTIRNDNRESNLELWVISHPAGARVEDIVAHAKEMLARYEPTALADSATLAS